MSVVHGNGFGIQGIGKVSGSVASFADSNGKPLRSCIVTMEPIQSGTGDPSPDNIRPISGRTECSVYSAPSIITFEPTQSGTGTPSQENPRPIVPGLTITRDDGTMLTVYGGTLDTAKRLLAVTWGALDGGDKGWVRHTTNSTSFAITTLSPRPLHIQNKITVISSTVRSVAPPAPPQPFLWASEDGDLRVKWADKESLTVSQFRSLMTGVTFCYRYKTPVTYQLSHTEVARAVETLGVTPVTVQLGRTVYGGTVDVVTGELTVNYKAIAFDGTENWNRQTTSGFPNRTYFYIKLIHPVANGRQYSSIFPYGEVSSLNQSVGFWCYFSNSGNEYRLAVRPSDVSGMSLGDFRTFLASSNLQVCYPTKPTTYQLTTERVATVLGANTVWSPDGPITAEYYKKSLLFMG